MSVQVQTNGVNGYHADVLVEEVKIPVPWGHIAGKWWGSKHRKPVIAVHGWQDNAGTFDKLAPLLTRQNLSVLCLDLPGHGLSSHLPKGISYYVFWDALQIVRRVAKHYKWKCIQMIGHSLGGATAFLYASVFPDEIECYVSLDIASPAVRDIPKFLNKAGESIDKFFKYETSSPEMTPIYHYDDMLDIVEKAYNGSCTRESCETMMKRGMRDNGDGTYHFSRDPRLKVGGLGMMDIAQAMECAKRIKCRVMNIRADPGMVFENPEYYDMVLDQIERNAAVLERRVVNGAHHVHLNDAASIADMIAEFLQ